jgi:hypothetical protein
MGKILRPAGVVRGVEISGGGVANVSGMTFTHVSGMDQ